MKSEVKIKSGRPPITLLHFNVLHNGEGIIDLEGHLRLRLSDDSYLHFSKEGETLGVDDKHNWPPHFESNQPIRRFKLIAEEI